MKKNSKWILMILGAIGGFLYWKFVGCESGSCPIKQNWMLMTAWGGTMGYLIGDMFKDKQSKEDTLPKNEIKQTEIDNKPNQGGTKNEQL